MVLGNSSKYIEGFQTFTIDDDLMLANLKQAVSYTKDSMAISDISTQMDTKTLPMSNTPLPMPNKPSSKLNNTPPPLNTAPLQPLNKPLTMPTQSISKNNSITYEDESTMPNTNIKTTNISNFANTNKKPMMTKNSKMTNNTMMKTKPMIKTKPTVNNSIMDMKKNKKDDIEDEEDEESEEDNEEDSDNEEGFRNNVETFQGSKIIDSGYFKNILLAMLIGFLGYITVLVFNNKSIVLPQHLKKFKNIIFISAFTLVVYICLEIF